MSLKDECSHWYSDSRQLVVLRPRSYTEKAIKYLVDLRKDRCHRVPSAEQSISLAALILRFPEFDTFVKIDPSLEKIFSRFELPQFMQALKSTTSYFVHLPRFSLTFEVQREPKFKILLNEHRGYALANVQSTLGLPVFFTHYLLLESCDPDNFHMTQHKVLIPQSRVVSVDNQVRLELDQVTSSTVYKTCVYELHALFGTWRASSVESRLLLAGIYAASSTSVPEGARIGMTGAEAALELLRQCWKNSPLTETEQRHLSMIVEVNAGRHAPIPLLCQHIKKSSGHLNILHSSDETELTNKSGDLIDAETDYMSSFVWNKHPVNHLRSLLTEHESEQRHYKNRLYTSNGFKFIGSNDLNNNSSSPRACVDLKEFDDFLSSDYAKNIEIELQKLVEPVKREAAKVPRFLNDKSASPKGKLEKDMNNDLLSSWDQHQKNPVYVLKDAKKSTAIRIESIMTQVAEKRAKAQKYLISKLTENARESSVRFDLLYQANRTPMATISDLVRISFDKGATLAHLNPFLFENEALRQTTFVAYVLRFMELCVLEEKMKRLRFSTRETSDQLLIRELMCVRKWSIDEHPRWLAFECDMCLQIRPEQYELAKHLLSTPGAISQLNMGLGKTRVVVPMLVLEMYGLQAEKVLRLHFLSTIINEPLDYFQRYLTASIFRIPLFNQPFNRSIQLTERAVSCMHASWHLCRRHRGVQILAPEHDLSLLLKYYELCYNKKNKQPTAADVESQHEDEVIFSRIFYQ